LKNIRYIIIFLAPILSYLFVTFYFNQLKDYDSAIFLGDQGTYFESGKYFYNQFDAHPYRCIGYPLLLCLPELIGLNAPYGYWPIIINILFLVGILYFLIRIENVLGYAIALPVSILLSICFGFISSVNLALTELGFVFFTMMASYFLLRLLNSERRDWQIFFLIFSLGCASLFRPGLYLFTLATSIICFFYFMLIDIKAGKKQFIFKSFLSISIALLITLGSQSLLMKKTYNTFRLSYIDDLAWYVYIGALANAIHENNCFSSECFAAERNNREENLINKSGAEMSVIAKEDRKNTLQNKKQALFKAYKINLATNLVSSSGWDKNEYPGFHNFSVLVNKILTLLPFGIYFLFLITKLRKSCTRTEHLFLLFIIGFIFYIFLTSGISTYQGDRFHVVFYPFSLVFLTFFYYKSKMAFRTR
jgi:hypothetical protein